MIAYATYGRGAPLLLIHDIGESGDVWLPFVRPLAPRYRLIVPDLRGHGRSAVLPRAESLGQMAEDLSQLLDALQLPACVTIAHAAGGALAARLAREDPQRINGLVMLRAEQPRRWGALGRFVRERLPQRAHADRQATLVVPVDGPLHLSVAPICAALLPWLERHGPGDTWGL
jgi:pimeloyl-ACP methyl ester carboxylesterase